MPEHEPYDIANYIGKETSIALDKTPIREKLDLPKIENLPRDLVAIAENVARISGTWNPVEIYTASNSSIETERAKLFESFDKGEEYNPNLTYEYANGLDLSRGRESLKHQMSLLRNFGEKKKRFWRRHSKKGGKLTLDRGTRLFRTALYFKIKDDLATCDLVEGMKTKNEDMIASALKQKYPGTDESILKTAQEEYASLAINGSRDEEKNLGNGLLSKEEIDWLKKKTLTSEEVAEAIKWSLSKLGILRTTSNGRGFYVKVDKEATSIDVRSKSTLGPTVFIPTDRTKPMSAFSLLPKLMHEIVGHARQDVNGEETFLLGGGRLKVDNEQLYEGLGLRYEFDSEKELYGIESSKPSPYYTLSTKLAEEGASFYKIFTDLIERRTRVEFKKPIGEEVPPFSSLSQEKQLEIKRQAWLGAYRVMRGHIDMSNKKKFAMAKDLGYLRGYQMDAQLKDNGLGYINEEGVIAQGGLAMLAELKLSPDKLPVPYINIGKQYFEEVLKPQMPKELAKAT